MEPLQKDNKGKSRSRSNTATSTKSRKRPLSRASTTSAHSGATQPMNGAQISHSAGYQKQWYEQSGHGHQRFEDVSNQMTPEEILMNSASQLQNPRGYDIDPSLHGQHTHPMTFPDQNHYIPENGRQSMPAEYVAVYGEDSQMLEGRSDEQDEIDSLTGAANAAKKGAKSSAANELEMRQLYQSNKHRSLPEVAADLHGNERGPQSERQRQVFAMLWISHVCHIGKGSVPRSRVYASYVSRCATERVTVLNPASFGKLVRVLFPGLKTRRLGVRGESKYHYVNFSLTDDQPEMSAMPKPQPTQSFTDAPSFASSSFRTTVPPQGHFPVDRAAFPSPEIMQQPEYLKEKSGGFIRPHSLYNQPEINTVVNLNTTTGKMAQRLQFVAPPEQGHEYEPISLPKIEPFMPLGTDPDSATALTALYRSHCTSLIECIRFCKEKTFFHLFTSFHGTLTMPVQKLFATPAIAPWIEECDFVMYQKMMKVVSPLTLQVAPKPVLDTLRSISEKLVLHIQSSFQGQPSHVVKAKIAPATLFAGLLDRELRVNLTAHAAANMLSNPANRDQMYEDWITMVRTRKVAECVPTRGMDDVVTLLLTELRDLLDPVGVSWELEGSTPYGEMALRTDRQQQSAIHADNSTENVLDRWVNFLVSLPGKFPYASHAEIVWCVQAVGTAVMRDLTINQGKSFGAWWVTKCWIDEMISFLAEQGGFMEYKGARAMRREELKQAVPSRAPSYNENLTSGTSNDFLRENGGVERAPSAPRPMDVTSQAAMNAAAGHDDSGIGMRTPDEDFTMGKTYEYERNGHPHNIEHMSHHGLQPTSV